MVRSWKRVHGIYNRLRSRYFLDAEAPLRVPPPADRLRWLWLAHRSPDLGVTHFDEDLDGETIALNAYLRPSARLLRVVLLHELTHLRDPRLNCGRGSKAWLREQLRLATLGAPLL